jgi:hypothetical protein
MKNKTWVVSGLLVAASLVCLGGPAAKAQDEGSKFDVTGMYSYLDHGMSCGNEFEGCFFDDPGLQGAKIAGVVNLNRHVGIECNLAYHAGTHNPFSEAASGDSEQDTERERDNVTTYLCGPKLTEPVGKFEVFGHFLAGAMHVSTLDVFSDDGNVDEEAAFKGTLFGLEVGGGVDWVHNHWGIRLLEVDYVHGAGTLAGRCTVDCEPGETLTEIESAHDVQIAMGVSFRFGKR